MAFCLNTNAAYVDFNRLVHDRFFVDKSAIIEKISMRINTTNRYICITKPRRFGKTSVLNMLGAYYGKAYDAKELFHGLEISKKTSFMVHLNQYNVITLCLNKLPDRHNAYEDYINYIQNCIKQDIEAAYPSISGKDFRSVADMLSATEDEFIFVVDEWDYIFRHKLYLERQGDFLEFLRNLLKDRLYVALAYMTGILPISQYNTSSSLNMFVEYTMLRNLLFEPYFGFTENEVELLCEKQTALKMNEIREWYNGYQMKNGERLYNPLSIVYALKNGTCQSYWARTGKEDEVSFFLKYNISGVLDDIIKMLGSASVWIDIEKEFTAGQKPPKNREETYFAMIIYGLLSYSDGELRIPNKELMIEFQKALKNDEFGYVAQLVRN